MCDSGSALQTGYIKLGYERTLGYASDRRLSRPFFPLCARSLPLLFTPPSRSRAPLSQSLSSLSIMDYAHRVVQLEQMLQSYQSLPSQLAACLNQIRELTAARDRALAECRAAQGREAELVRQNELLQVQCVEYVATIKDLRDSRDVTSEELRATRLALENANRERAAEQAASELLRRQLAQANRDRDELRRENARCQSALDEALTLAHTHQETAQLLQQVVTNNEAELAAARETHRRERDALVRQLREQYSRQYDTTVERYEMQLNLLRERIEQADANLATELQAQFERERQLDEIPLAQQLERYDAELMRGMNELLTDADGNDVLLVDLRGDGAVNVHISQAQGPVNVNINPPQ